MNHGTPVTGQLRQVGRKGKLARSSFVRTVNRLGKEFRQMANGQVYSPPGELVSKLEDATRALGCQDVRAESANRVGFSFRDPR